MDDRKKSEVHSLSKAMELLEIMNRSRTPMSLAKLSSVSGYPKSTIHAMLSTMRDYGCVEQRENGDYYLGIKLYEWGSNVEKELHILPSVHGTLELLAEQTESTALLTLMDGIQVIVIDQVVNGDRIRITTDVGRQLPLHATSQGKLLMASLPDTTVKHLLRQANVPAFTPHTKVDTDDFLKEMSIIRRRGYAVEDGEYKIGLRSVSAPIYDKNNVLRYALCVVGLFRTTHDEHFDRIIDLVCASARDLSDILSKEGVVEK